jgi:hypothetical protein
MASHGTGISLHDGRAARAVEIYNNQFRLAPNNHALTGSNGGGADFDGDGKPDYLLNNNIRINSAFGPTYARLFFLPPKAVHAEKPPQISQGASFGAASTTKAVRSSGH